MIPNWNGARHLATCLDSLSLQTYDEREVLVVDNGSTDESQNLVHSRFSWARWIPLGRNHGFVGAVNAGIRASHGQVVALLNNDTEADRDWLSAICAAFRQNPGVSMCATKLLLFDRRDTLHSAGDFYGWIACLETGGSGRQTTVSTISDVEAFGACGGAAGYRRELFDDIGLFDPRLFMYCEDVDLSLRSALAGHRCRFVSGRQGLSQAERDRRRTHGQLLLRTELHRGGSPQRAHAQPAAPLVADSRSAGAHRRRVGSPPSGAVRTRQATWPDSGASASTRRRSGADGLPNNVTALASLSMRIWYQGLARPATGEVRKEAPCWETWLYWALSSW